MHHRSFLALVLTLGTLACNQPPPARRLTPVERERVVHQVIVPAPVKPNPYLPDVQAHRAAWRARGLHDYVMVVDMPGNVQAASMFHLRVVVRDDRVVEANGLLYGGSPRLEHAPTMETIFDSAESYAAFGEGNVPVRFSIEYEPTHGAVMGFESDGRLEIADDEGSLHVYCFSADPAGCVPQMMKHRECTAIRGRVAAAGDGSDCNGQVVGMVSTSELCCRPWEGGKLGNVTPAACRAAGGVLTTSGERTDMDLGYSHDVMRGCVRPFVR